LAALPVTFDHAPQHLWERSIISGIRKRDAASRKHDLGLVTELMVADDLSDPNAATIFRDDSDVKTISKTAQLHWAYTEPLMPSG
jgi:hypothetical protein